MDQQRAFGDFVFVCLLCLNAAQAAGNHNRFVVAANLTVKLLFKSAEVAQEVRAAEFVVERRAADGAFNHDVQRRGNVFRLAVVLFPRLFEVGDVEVGDGKAGQARFRTRTFARCAFVADFAARTRCRARKRRNGGRVVVRFHFHDDMRVFLVETVALVFRRIRIETLDFRAFNHGRVVFIGDDRAFGMRFVRVAYHAEEGFRLFFAVEDEIGVEDFVAAVFAVCLREHHQLHIGRIALQSLIVFNQIIDFVGGECQTHFGIGFDQSLFTAAQNIDGGEGFGFEMVE